MRLARAFSLQQSWRVSSKRMTLSFTKTPLDWGRTGAGGREADAVTPTARVEVTLGCLAQGWEQEML